MEQPNYVSGILWLAQHAKNGTIARETILETLLYSFNTREEAEAALTEMITAGQLKEDGSFVWVTQQRSSSDISE